jgi:hypothetical protein
MNQPARFLVCAVIGLVTPMAYAETPTPSGPGIEGTIVVFPAQPGPLRKDGPEAVPVGQITFDVRKDNQKVASFTTDAEGRFQVSLPPGRYVIDRSDPGAAVGHWRFETEVVVGKVTKVRWTGDSGMR